MHNQSASEQASESVKDPAAGDSARWLTFICLFFVALSLFRFAAGPFSVVGVLGDIGDYSVPYLMASAGDVVSSNMLPMDGSALQAGFFAPAQYLIHLVLPGWLANGLNWLVLSLAAATGSYFLAVRHFGLPANWAALAAILSGAAVTNGNLGYAVVAFVPIVLFQALNFVRVPSFRSALLLAVAGLLLGTWTPAKFLVLFPALMLVISIMVLGSGRVRLRAAACLIVCLSVYVFRFWDLQAFLMATATSDRAWAVERQPIVDLLLLGFEYAFEYADPRLIFEMRPLPQTNPTSVAFFLIAVALVLRTMIERFPRLVALLAGLTLLQVLFPAIWQWILFDLLDKPGIYFHFKLWRPVMPLLYIGAGCACASIALRYGPSVAHRFGNRRGRQLLQVPLILVAIVVALQTTGFAARSWLVDGSFRALYQDQAISLIAEKNKPGKVFPSRAIILGKPNGFLAPYGLRTPFGRSEWLSHRYAILLRAAGLSADPATDAFYQGNGVPAVPDESDLTKPAFRNFLALTSVEWVFSRNHLPADLFSSHVAEDWKDWSDYSQRQRIEHSARSNFSGKTALAAFRYKPALPTLYSVTRYEVVDTARQAATRILTSPTAELPDFAVIERDSNLAAHQSELTRVVLESVVGTAGGIEIRVKSDGQGLLVVTELLDHGWNYFVDGQVAEVIAVNAAFVGLPVPRGQHELLLQRVAID